MRFTISILIVTTAPLAGCQPSLPLTEPPLTASPPAMAGDGLAIAEVASQYAEYQKMTPKEVYVNYFLAMSCVGADEDDVLRARRTHGPHANTAILVYMNEKAAQAVQTGAKTYPVGSAIVKHKSILGYRDRKTHKWVIPADNGVGGMIKRPSGFDPHNGDWEYFYFEDEKQIESGRIQTCIQCHRSAQGTDYVFGSWRHSQVKNDSPSVHADSSARNSSGK